MFGDREKVGTSLMAMVGLGFLLLVPVKLLRSETNQFQAALVTTDPIVGSWFCVIPPAGGAPQFVVIKNIHLGGTESEIDNAAPPSLESPTVGTWRPSGGSDNKGIPSLKYWQDAYQMIWDPSGAFIGTFHYFGPMVLNHSLTTLDINGTATLYGPDGSVITTFPFTANCTRLVGAVPGT